MGFIKGLFRHRAVQPVQGALPTRSPETAPPAGAAANPAPTWLKTGAASAPRPTAVDPQVVAVREQVQKVELSFVGLRATGDDSRAIGPFEDRLKAARKEVDEAFEAIADARERPELKDWDQDLQGLYDRVDRLDHELADLRGDIRSWVTPSIKADVMGSALLALRGPTEQARDAAYHNVWSYPIRTLEGIAATAQEPQRRVVRTALFEHQGLEYESARAIANLLADHPDLRVFVLAGALRVRELQPGALEAALAQARELPAGLAEKLRAAPPP